MREPGTMYQDALEEPFQAEVIRALRDGQEHARRRAYDAAIGCYDHALALLPAPMERWKAALGLVVARADALFRSGRFREARETLLGTIQSPRAYSNPFIHLRLGQALLECGERHEAAGWLAGAYLGGGRELFASEEPKYQQFVEAILRPPDGFSSWDEAHAAGWQGFEHD